MTDREGANYAGVPPNSSSYIPQQKHDSSSPGTNIGAGSGPSSLAFSGDNEEEYLRNTWQKLGVGHDGFLSLEELTKVCYAIGMEKTANEVIEQLFSRLDVDGDGRISFEEFLHMFQSGGPAASHSFALDDSVNQEPHIPSASCPAPLKSNSSGLFLNEFGGVFSCLDPEGTGFVSVSRLLEIWFGLGVNDGPRILRDWGLQHRHGERISVQDLSLALEDEWRPSQEDATTSTTPRHVAFITLLHEIKGLRLSVETARAERDKYRWNLGESNHRLSLLAQELEENNVQMEASSQQQMRELEKLHREQIRELQEALNREREMARDHASDESREILTINAQLQEEEGRLKSRLESLEGEIRRLENENMDLNDRMKESDHHLHIMDRQILELKQLKCKVAEFESLSPREEEYRSLLQRVEILALENQRLRDENDEFVAQLDAYSAKGHPHLMQKDRSLDGSCMGDYIEQSSGFLGGGVKRRGGGTHWGGSGEEDSSGDEEESPRGKKVKKTNLSKDINFHYMDVTAYDESFDVSLPLQGLDKSTFPSPRPIMSSSFTRYNSATSPIQALSGSLTIVPRSSTQPASLPSTEKLPIRISLEEDSNCERELDSRLQEKRLKLTQLNKEIQRLQDKRTRLDFQNEAEGTTDQLMDTMEFDEISPKSSSAFMKPSASTPVKQQHFSYEKCSQCVELENRLMDALKEVETALTQKDEEAREKLHLQSIIQAFSRAAPTAATSQDESESQNDVGSSSKMRMEALQEHCRDLEGELVEVRFQILKMVEEREMVEKENERLRNKFLKKTQGVSKTMKRRCRDLTEKLKRKRMALTSGTDATYFQDPLHSRDDITTILEVDEPPEGEDEEESQKDTKEIGTLSERDEMEGEVESYTSPLEQEMDTLERELTLYEDEMMRERDTLEKQKAALEERCSRLDQELQVSKSELKKIDDYWLLKFKEEQDYYDEERKLYDENFSALESKIKEYEAVVLSNPSVPSEIVVSGLEGNISDDSDRLSTIDESVVFEKQVTELEEEASQMKQKIHHLIEEKERVKSSLETQLLQEKERTSEEINLLRQELDSTQSLVKAYEDQAVVTKEELEIAQRLSEEKSIQFLQSMIYGDVRSEAASGSRNMDGASASMEKHLITQYQSHILRLQNALQMHQKNSNQILHLTYKIHKSEVQSLQTQIAATQQVFTSNLAKYKDQLTKAGRNESLLLELYLENSQLMKALELTEERQKRAEATLRNIQITTLMQSPSPHN